MKKGKLINFKITEEDFEQLKKEADKLRISVSALIRCKIYSKDKEG